MEAQVGLDWLLSRLTTVLVNEAQLLGGIRGEVEFIKDEMESMNGLLLHLTEAQHRDHQVRAWMKQVASLTRDCGGNVELYVHYVRGGSAGGRGILGFLLRIPRFLRTIRVRCQIATRIRELKVRARDVGDRRKRYGVTFPTAQPYHNVDDDRPAPQAGSPEEEEDFRRRELLHRSCCTVPDIIILEEVTNEVLERLSEKGEDVRAWPRVIAITGSGGGEPGVARRVHQHSSVVSSFEHRVFVDLATMHDDKDISELCLKIIEQLPTPPAILSLEGGELLPTPPIILSFEGEELYKVKEHLEGKKFIIFLDNVRCSSESYCPVVGRLVDFLQKHTACSVGSSIIVSTPENYMPCANLVPEIHIQMQDLLGRLEYFQRRALALAKCHVPMASDICLNYNIDTFALQMFFRLIYVSPKFPASEMEQIVDDLKNHQSNTGQVMLRFCYKYLPSNYKRCLLYLSIFLQDHELRRTRLLRRWIAEALVSQRSNLRFKHEGRQGISMLDDEAEHIFDALVTRGFLHPKETSAGGKIKTFTVNSDVHRFIAGEFSHIDTCMGPDLAHRFSINNGVELQEAPYADHPSNDVLILLEQITKSVPGQLLKVLDLEGCRGLTKKHLKSICQILLLKYLSLRDTDVKELPKQIEKLQCLETLDIRQTMVQAFCTKPIKLPMLKYFLAGHRDSSSNSFSKFKDPFTAVCLPRGIQRMKKLQVLSYVEVSDNIDDLNDVGQLLQLRKLGVILHHNEGVLSVLFRQIEKLHGCLRSLSIRINQPVKGKAPDTEPQATAMNTPPIHLQSLNISGITSGPPLWIAVLDQLEEISLSETYLGDDAMNILSKLRILRCLRLLQESYTQCKLNFKEDEFQQLRSLVVEGSHVTNISFDMGTTPKLRTIVWSFSSMEVISGLNHLPRLKKLELHGNCDLNPVTEALQSHLNFPVLEHNPRHQPQEDRTAAAVASSSSAA